MDRHERGGRESSTGDADGVAFDDPVWETRGDGGVDRRTTSAAVLPTEDGTDDGFAWVDPPAGDDDADDDESGGTPVPDGGRLERGDWDALVRDEAMAALADGGETDDRTRDEGPVPDVDFGPRTLDSRDPT